MAENVKLTLNPERPEAAAGAAGQEAAAPAPRPGAPAQIVDELGRTLTLREIEVLEEQDLIGMIGEPMCLNRLYMMRALNACTVAAIDGDPVPFPLTAAELRIAMKRLRRAGLDAVMKHEFAVREGRERERVAVAKK